MSKIVKPDMTYVWASGGSKTAPSNVKIQTGWIVEKPEFQKMNWVQNRQDDALAYIFQMGIPEWDSAVEYQYSATYTSYVQKNGLVYKALQVGTNKNPATEAAYWALAFDNSSSAATVQTNLNTHITNYGTLSSLSNAATARSNLGVYSTAQVDSGLELKALLAGSSSQLFSVANGTTGNEAVNYSQLITKAPVAGNSGQEFAVATATTGNSAVNKTQFDAAISPFTGTVFPHVGTAVPTGFLLCNGSAVSRTAYSALFAVIGTVWGVGNGSTTFNLPDGRAKGFLGADASKGDDATLTVGTYVAQQGGIKTIVTSTGGSPAIAPATITVPQNGTASALFVTGDAIEGTDQSMTVANTAFVYPRSFVGQWIIKT